MRNVFILAAAALGGLASATPSTRYTIIGLGDLPGGATYSEGLGLNDSGQVVGRSHSAFGNSAFIWDPINGMQDLGDFPGGLSSSYATGINIHGHVAGYGSSLSNRGFLWTPEEGMQNLGDLPGGWDISYAYAINDLGTVVGYSYGATDYQGFIWSNGTMSPLPGLRSPTSFSHAYAVNNLNQVTGIASGLTGQVAFRWDSEHGMIDLGDLPGGNVNSRGNGINDQGQIVGWGSPALGRRAVLWTESNAIVPLGDLPNGTGSNEANDINNWGVVVGKATILSGTRGFIWTPEDGMVDLNTLLVPGQGFTITSATAINDNGQITGIATKNGVNQAFLATPLRDITGTVVFGDFDGQVEGQPIQYWIQSGDYIVAGTVLLDAQGKAAIPAADIEDGWYTLILKGSHWLTKSNAIRLSGGAAQFAATLVNGDCDGDNEIGISDYALISFTWGLSEGDPGWEANVDLNGDSAIDIGDYAILSANFGQVGE
ncbi:MAG: hypothetical protein K1X67_08685 [Fimbriimonadaceae bacterium]|nr:hypothetical protein [Fimbriimonadaceae bacterium]